MMLLNKGIIAGFAATVALVAQASPLGTCIGLQADDKALIVNADDLGMHPDLDRAAFKLIDAGLIQDLSIMPPTPNADQVIAMAKERKLTVGVHLTLTNEWQGKQGWGGVLPKSDVPSLYNPNGYFWPSVDELVRYGRRDEMKKELIAQINKVKNAGLSVTHMDAHMLFWNASDEMEALYISLSKELGIPIVMQTFWDPYDVQQKNNLALLRREGVVVPDTYSMHYNPDQRKRGLAYRGYLNLLDALPAGVHAVAIHPAEDSPDAQKAIADLTLRLSDYQAWQSPELQKKITQQRFKKINYGSLHQLQQAIKNSTGVPCLSKP